MQQRKVGFTLIELLIVLTVVATLALIVITSVRGAAIRAREAQLRENLHFIRMAITMFQTDVGGFPSQLSDLTLSREDAASQLPETDAAGNHLDASKYKGPYLRPGRITPDPFAVDGQWEYDPATGRIACNTTRTALDGTPYSAW